MTTEEQKRALREEMKARRKALDPAWAAEASSRAQARLLASPAFAGAKTVALYAADSGEVDTAALHAACVAADKCAVYPRVPGGAGVQALEFAEVRNPAVDLEPRRFGILAPGGSAQEVDLSDIDLFVIPGLAFDASGGRLGRGRGYYDATLLAAGPRAARVGLAFDFQVVTAVPAFEHDARVAALATEERWLEVTPS